MNKNKKGFPVPHVYVILLSLIALCSLLSYVIPAGQYDMTAANGREVVDAATYHTVEATPVTLMQMLSAVPRGMTESAQIIFFIFIVGGAFAILQRTGAIEAGIGKVCQLLKGRTLLLLPVIITLFSLGGAVFGMSEETIPFVPIFVSLCIAMGYDSLTGTAIVFCGAAAGYAGAFMNPFTLQVAQGIASLPILSGMGFRLVMYAAYVLLSSAFIMAYATRVKRNPERSPMYEADRAREDVIDLNNLRPFGTQEKAVLLVFLAAIVLLVVGVIRWGWYMDEISALFMGMAIVVAVVARMTPNEFAVTVCVPVPAQLPRTFRLFHGWSCAGKDSVDQMGKVDSAADRHAVRAGRGVRRDRASDRTGTVLRKCWRTDTSGDSIQNKFCGRRFPKGDRKALWQGSGQHPEHEAKQEKNA